MSWSSRELELYSIIMAARPSLLLTSWRATAFSRLELEGSIQLAHL